MENDSNIKCPYCSSTNYTVGKKGFGFGKAAVGAVLLGPAGLLAGGIGSKDLEFTCLNCGKTYKLWQGKIPEDKKKGVGTASSPEVAKALAEYRAKKATEDTNSSKNVAIILIVIILIIGLLFILL